jgi:hypothetical protein
LPQQFVPICYLALQNKEKFQALLLIEDLSKTHNQTEWPVVPNLNDCKQAVGKLAALRALWWNHPHLDTDLLPMLTHGNYWSSRLEEAIEKLPAFLDFIGDRLSSKEEKFTRQSWIHRIYFGGPNVFVFPEHFFMAMFIFGIFFFQTPIPKAVFESSIGIHGILEGGPMTWRI